MLYPNKTSNDVNSTTSDWKIHQRDKKMPLSSDRLWYRDWFLLFQIAFSKFVLNSIFFVALTHDCFLTFPKVPPISTVNNITIKSENISSGSSVSSQQFQKNCIDNNGSSYSSGNQINGFDSPYYSPPKSTTTKTTVSASPKSQPNNGNQFQHKLFCKTFSNFFFPSTLCGNKNAWKNK